MVFPFYPIAARHEMCFPPAVVDPRMVSPAMDPAAFRPPQRRGRHDAPEDEHVLEFPPVRIVKDTVQNIS